MIPDLAVIYFENRNPDSSHDTNETKGIRNLEYEDRKYFHAMP